MKRIYLSGPMTGRPDLNFPAFHGAAMRLRALGYEVVSPAELAASATIAWHDAMRIDIKALLDCDTLALLEGWQESAGAHIEMHVAHRVGITIAIEAEIVERAPDPQPEIANNLLAALSAVPAKIVEQAKGVQPKPDRLIAAAPDLLEALRELEESTDWVWDNRARVKARAAIAKATGKEGQP